MEKNRNALLAEFRAQISTNEATFDAEKQNIENHPMWKECGEMVMVDRRSCKGLDNGFVAEGNGNDDI